MIYGLREHGELGATSSMRCSRMRGSLVLIAAAVAGLVIWLTIASVTGEAEAWDSPLYLLIGLPLMFLLAVAGAFICTNVRVAIGFAIVSLQFGALVFGTPSNLRPLAWIGGGAFFTIFGAACTGGGIIGSALKQARNRPG